MKLYLFNIMLLTALLSCPAWGAESLPPVDFKGQYEFTFSGLPFGKMGTEATQTAERYAVTNDVMSTGLIGFFIRHTSHTTVEGNGGNLNYESHYQTKKKKKYVKMVRKDGKLVEDTLIPPDNPATRALVPLELSHDAVDPLTFMLAMRKGVWDARKNNTPTFSIKAFDGRRLTQANFTYVGAQKIVFNHEKIPVIAVDVRRKLLAGFTDKEIASIDPDEPTLHVYFSDDGRMIPLRLEATAWFGTLAATLVKECKDGESCLLGNKE